MENVAQENEKAISGAIKIDEKEIRTHLDGFRCTGRSPRKTRQTSSRYRCQGTRIRCPCSRVAFPLEGSVAKPHGFAAALSHIYKTPSAFHFAPLLYRQLRVFGFVAVSRQTSNLNCRSYKNFYTYFSVKSVLS